MNACLNIFIVIYIELPSFKQADGEIAENVSGNSSLKRWSCVFHCSP